MLLKLRSFRTLLQQGIRSLGREFFWVVLGQAFAALGSIIGIRFLTHAMTPDTYGQLALWMTVSTLVGQTVFGPLAGAILRFFSPAYESHQLSAYLKSVSFLLKWATAVIVVLVFGATFGLLINDHQEWVVILWATTIFSLINSYSQAMDGIQNAARQRVIVAWHVGVSTWLRPVVAVALIALLGSYSQVVMLGYLLSSLLILGSQSIFFRRRILILKEPEATGREKRSAWTGQLLTYAWPFATWGVFTWAQLSSDRWALQLFGTTSMVGYYAILYQLGYYPMTLVSGVLVQLVTPILFGWAGSGGDPERMRRVWRATIGLVSAILLLSIVAAAIAFLAHGFVFSLLVAPEYRVISPLLPGMVLAGGLFAAGQAALLFVMSNNKTRSLIVPKIVTALLGVGFNIVGAFLGGVGGVVLASVLFSFVYCLWTFWVARDFAKSVLTTDLAVAGSGEIPV